MRVLSAITDRTVAARILHCLALPSRAPPLATSLGGRVRPNQLRKRFPTRFWNSTSISPRPTTTPRAATENHATLARLHIAFAVLMAKVRVEIDRAVLGVRPRAESAVGKA